MSRYIATQKHRQNQETSKLRKLKKNNFDDLAVLGQTSKSKEIYKEKRPRNQLRTKFKDNRSFSKTSKNSKKFKFQEKYSTGEVNTRLNRSNYSHTVQRPSNQNSSRAKNLKNSKNGNISKFETNQNFHSSQQPHASKNVFAITSAQEFRTNEPRKIKSRNSSNLRKSEMIKNSKKWMNQYTNSAKKKRYEDIKSLYNSLNRSTRRDQYGFTEILTKNPKKAKNKNLQNHPRSQER